MKAARQDMHKNMLGLKHLQQESDEEHKSRENPRHEHPKNRQSVSLVRYKNM